MCDYHLLIILPYYSPDVSLWMYSVYAGYYGQRTLLLHDVQCTGCETKLIECRANTISVHGYRQAAGVKCPS